MMKLTLPVLAFGVRYSLFDLPAMPAIRFELDPPYPVNAAVSVALQSIPQGRRVFCGSLLNFYAACKEVFV